MNHRRFFRPGAISGLLLALTATVSGAERFDDIVVAPQSLASGDTFHGYREFRVVLENQSTKSKHIVTLSFPDRSFGYGNSVSRVSRTVSLGPLSRAAVPIWQPPLPVNGNGMIQVAVDGSGVGSVTLPGSSQHVTRSGSRFGGGGTSQSILVSRSLNFEDAGKVFKTGSASRTAFGASSAVGSPDAGTRRGMVANAWMPEPSSSPPHWLELDYEPPLAADHIIIHETMGLLSGGEITLKGVSGTNVVRTRIPPPSSVMSSPSATEEVRFALTVEPIRTVRLEFAAMYAGAIAIDAVELCGPTGNGWASAARASSESSMSSPSIPGSAVDPRELLRSEAPIADWSEHWLSYSAYDAVAVTAADLRAAPAGVQDALWRYTECGGNLLVLGGGDVPAPWRPRRPAVLDGGQAFKVGFGQCFVAETDRISGLRPLMVKMVLQAVDASAHYWQSIPTDNAANANFPVIDDIRVPIRGMVLIMFVFVIAIGPVNLIVLARLKRRTWLLWTVPAISFITCLIVFMYSLFSEGVTPDVRTESLTVLDQVNRRAASVGTTAFYCPLTPSQGLFFEGDTEATPLVELWDYRSGSDRTLDWTRSQHLERGWITARVPAHFRLRKSELRRERIQVDYGAGQRTAMNGLGARIHSLWLADSKGQIYTATGIAPGETATLSACVSHPKVYSQSGLRTFLDRPGAEPLDGVTNSATDYLLPDTYVAELETNPFLENGLGPKAKSARTRARCVVYGILETP
jgi:hypothetical protein